MSTVANLGTFPTLLDMVKRKDPDGSIAMIVEALTQRNPILQDAMALEGNLTTGHRVTIRSGLPSLTWRRINQGIDATKSSTVQVDETCGMLEGRSHVDAELVRLDGNGPAFRASEDRGFMQAMNNEAATAIFYHSTKTDPEKIHGFTPRYKALTADDNSDNVLDNAITSTGADQSSIWFITWGPDTAYLIYPRGTTGGMSQEDLGKEYVDDKDGKKFLAWRTHFIWRLGLCIKDWRYHVRVANIDNSAASGSGTQLIDSMIEGYNHIYDLNVGQTVIYCNRTIMTLLDKQVMNQTYNGTFSYDTWMGKRLLHFRGIPIRLCDALTTAEAIVT